MTFIVIYATQQLTITALIEFKLRKYGRNGAISKNITVHVHRTILCTANKGKNNNRYVVVAMALKMSLDKVQMLMHL